jgi:hypothetical protein
LLLKYSQFLRSEYQDHLSEELLTSVLYFKVSDCIPNYSDCHCKLSMNLLAK